MAALPPNFPPQPPQFGRGQPLHRAQPKAAPIGRGKPLSAANSKIPPPPSYPAPKPSKLGQIGNERITKASIGKSPLAFDKVDFTSPGNFYIQFDKLSSMDQFLIKSNLIELYKNLEKEGDFESKSSQAYLKNLVSEPVTPEKLKKAKNIAVSIQTTITDPQKLRNKIDNIHYEDSMEEIRKERPQYAHKLNLAEGFERVDPNDRKAFILEKINKADLTEAELNDFYHIIASFHKIDDSDYSKFTNKYVLIYDIIEPLLIDKDTNEIWAVSSLLNAMPRFGL